MKQVAVYPGTFDPFTNGHLDIVKRAAQMYEKVVIGVSDHGRKNTLFENEKRCESIRHVVENMPNVEVVRFDNLLTQFAKTQNASAIIRGLRVTSDFEYEFKMAQFIEDQAPDMEVVYLMASRRTLHISSSSIKEVARLKGDISSYVPKAIEEMVKEAYENC